MLLGEQASLVWGNPLLPLQRDLRHFLEPPVDLLLFPENWGQNIIIIFFFLPHSVTFRIWRDWGQEEKGTTEDEMAGWHHQLDGHECE